MHIYVPSNNILETSTWQSSAHISASRVDLSITQSNVESSYAISQTSMTLNDGVGHMLLETSSQVLTLHCAQSSTECIRSIYRCWWCSSTPDHITIQRGVNCRTQYSGFWDLRYVEWLVEWLSGGWVVAYHIPVASHRSNLLYLGIACPNTVYRYNQSYIIMNNQFFLIELG